MVSAAQAALVLTALYLNAGEARQCVSDSIGLMEGQKVELTTVVLVDQENTLRIPDGCYVLGPNYKYVGMEVTACDTKMPMVEAKSLHLAIIELQDVTGSALASVAQYCIRTALSQPGQREKEDESVSLSTSLVTPIPYTMKHFMSQLLPVLKSTAWN